MTYYSIHIPSKTDSEDENDKPLVFTDFQEALKIFKTHKEARLKTFKNNRDALKFSQIGLENATPNKSSGLKSPSASTAAAAAEKAAFRAPTKQELIQFRKTIEEGKYEVVEKTIWENPRYLVNVGDTPSSLKDGTRYNALHVCAIHKQPKIAELILKTISKVDFIELLHGKKNEKVCQEVCDILLDYYLNMPEKGRSETPLHLAVKFGAVEVVEVLTSYPQCKMTPNLDKMLPKDIVCSRVNDAKPELKNRISILLEERFYVPVIRSVDNSLPPVIGEPFSIINPPELNNDPLSPECEIQAYAGPMNKDQAQSFRRRWKTPPRVANSSSSSGSSPLKLNSTPQKAIINNNSFSPMSTKQHTPNALFPDKSGELGMEDSQNGNCDSINEESNQNNNKMYGFNMPLFNPNNTLRRQRRDIFFTYREQRASPLNFDGLGTPKTTDSIVEVESISSDSPLKERHLKLSDTEKGLELIGRELAKEHQVDWKEYWDFLSCFVDISSPEGLSKLENYLKERKENQENQKNQTLQREKEEALFDGLCYALNKIEFKKNALKTTSTPTMPNMNMPSMKISQTNHLTSNNASQTTAPYLCVEKSMQVFAKRMTKTIMHNLESVVSINDAFNSELKRLKSLVCSFKDDSRFVNVNFNLVHSRFANLIVAFLKNTENQEGDEIAKTKACFEKIVEAKYRIVGDKSPKSQFDKKEQLLCVSEFILNNLNSLEDKILPENLKTEQICMDIWEKETICSCHWEPINNRHFHRNKRLERLSLDLNRKDNDIVPENVYADPSNNQTEEEEEQWENVGDSSNDNSDGEDEETYWSDIGSEISDDGFYTPPESPSMLEQDVEDEFFEKYNIYLLGDQPTKRDLDVCNALFNTDVSRELYPHVHRWRAAVLRHSLEERDNFPSPSIVVKRRVDGYNINSRICLARRLFSSPLRTTPSSKLSDSSGLDLPNQYRSDSVSRKTSLNGSSSSIGRTNLSLAFMNVSDI